jgi:REP element-mobilizing transposase RayT
MDETLYQFRKPIRLKDYDYSWAGYYFVTLVSYQRKNIFGEITDDIVQLTKVGEIVENCWNEIPSHYSYVEVDAYIVMPNHFHGILIINEVGARHRKSIMSNHNHPIEARHASPLQRKI